MRHFGRLLSFGSVLAVMVAFASTDAIAQKKKDAKDKDAKDKDAPASGREGRVRLRSRPNAQGRSSPREVSATGGW